MANLRLTLSQTALVENWRGLARRAGVPATAAGVAVKADGYGLGARAVVARLHAAGARLFAVSTFAEAEALGPPGADGTVLVLHGFARADAPAAVAMPWARPVLNTPAQVAAWADLFPGRPADLMVDTGMNRLGLAATEVAPALAAVPVDTLHSHLAAADEPDHPLNARQRDRFAALAAATPGVRHCLANSAGACLGPAYAFDGIRVGIGVYGGTPAPGQDMAPVVAVEALVLQVRAIAAGEPVGYGATWTAPRPSRVATVNLGYADGFPRALAPHLVFDAGGARCPAIGRLSMDLVTVDVTGAHVAEGDWLPLALDIPALARAGGMSQYELLVALSRRYERSWT